MNVAPLIIRILVPLMMAVPGPRRDELLDTYDGRTIEPTTFGFRRMRQKRP